MKTSFRNLVLAAFLLFTAPGFAQNSGPSITIVPTPIGKGYWGSGLDAAIFQTSRLDRPGLSDTKFSTLRFTYVINIGVSYNYDFSNSFGAFTGIGIKNIGFIDKIADSTIKRRAYTIGVPLGIKIGNLAKRNYVMLGGGIDVPFNYREKGFVRRGDKTKFSEWFSDRTEKFMPYVFIGGSINPGISIKAQYYPMNFLNTDFIETKNGANFKPYAGYEVNLMLLSVGFSIQPAMKPKPSADDAAADNPL